MAMRKNEFTDPKYRAPDWVIHGVPLGNPR
jgi:hypothetical protein